MLFSYLPALRVLHVNISFRKTYHIVFIYVHVLPPEQLVRHLEIGVWRTLNPTSYTLPLFSVLQ